MRNRFTRRKTVIAAAGAVAVLLLLAPSAVALPAGSPDPSFGNAGKHILEIEGGIFNDVAQYTDGPHEAKLVASGIIHTGEGALLLLARFNPDGSLDPSFGQSGLVRRDFGGGGASKLALDPSGDILVLTRRGLARFRSDGTLDDGDGSSGGFGDCGCGYVPPSPDSVFADLTLDVGGGIGPAEILVAGRRRSSVPGDDERDMAEITRFTSTGDVLWQRQIELSSSPDSPEAEWDDRANGIEVRPDGDILVGGSHGIHPPDFWETTTHLGAARLNRDGTTDESYGSDGGNSVDMGEAGRSVRNFAVANDLALDADGGVVIAGGHQGPAADPSIAPVLRLTQAGFADTAFSEDGELWMSAKGATIIDEAAIDDAGRILLAGMVDSHPMFASDGGVVRLLPGGASDQAFGDSGLAQLVPDSMTEFDKANGVNGLSLDEDRVTVAGSWKTPKEGRPQPRPVLARFLTEVTPDAPVGGGPGGGAGGATGGGQGGVAGGVATNARNVEVHKLLVPKSLRKLFARGIRVVASCEEDCRILLEVRVSKAIAKAMGLKGTLLGKGSAPADPFKRRWVIAKLTGAARRALAAWSGGGRFKINITGLAD